MVLKFALLLAAAGLVAMPAIAQDKPVEQARKDDPDKKICRTIRNSGSRLGGQRECHTKAEWERMSASVGDAMRGAARPN